MAVPALNEEFGVSVPKYVIDQLDHLRRRAKDAEEEYLEYLREVEGDYGTDMRDSYESKYA